MRVWQEGTRFYVEGQGIRGSFEDVGVNRKVAVVFLRSLQSVETGRALFTLQELALVVGSSNRQAASEHVEQFRGCGEDFGKFIRRQRKVDQQVVEAVEQGLFKDPLADVEVLRRRVEVGLGRTDLSEQNIRVALDQISYGQMRGVLRGQLEVGQVHYEEEALLEEMLSKGGERGDLKGGLEVEKVASDRVLVDPTGLRKLLEPGASLEEVPRGLQQICWCLAFYYWGVPLSRLGLWMGVCKSTVWRWMMGFVAEIFGMIKQKVVEQVRLGILYVDEKWVKIKGKWHYWFVALDEKTEIPLVCYLSPTKSRWVCRWIGLWLKKFKGKAKAVITDGLQSYRYLLPDVPHLLCHFHHQQGVTAWIREHLQKAIGKDQPKSMMKQVIQTEDKRTVQRRLCKLEGQAEALGIKGWIDKTREHLPELLPSVGSRVLPKTTNAIERFFRAFNRFYKVRCGFKNLSSARDQLCLFLVGYLFSQRDKDGLAPIEAIWPEAANTPLYRLLNDPFGMRTDLKDVKQTPDMADESAVNLLAA